MEADIEYPCPPARENYGIRLSTDTSEFDPRKNDISKKELSTLISNLPYTQGEPGDF